MLSEIFMLYHRFDTDQLFNHFNTWDKGLSSEQVSARIHEYGPNEIPEHKKTDPWSILLNQFKDFMILILIIAAIISGYIGDLADTIIILFIVLINAIIGFYQEYKAERALDALKKMSALHCQVVRNGQSQHILTNELVPGDIVIIEAGNTIPADIRLFEVFSLKIDESVLTGESVTSEKTSIPILHDSLALGDMHNMVFKGTTATYGRGKGIVVSTGLKTEIGKIAALLQHKETKTSLQIKMGDFSKKLSFIILAICCIIFVAGWLRGEAPMHMLLLAISLAVAAIPEALPALITIALARGSARMVKKNALIRKLPAVETLGSVNYICTDKTGTLTENKMTVTQVNASCHFPEGSGISLQLLMSLNNDVVKQNHHYHGDPTEVALAEYVDQYESSEAYVLNRERYKRVGEVPFDSDRKLMTTIHSFGSGFLVVTKGAAESVAALLKDEHSEENEWEEIVDDWTNKGLRVLMYAYRTIDRYKDNDLIETQLHYGGLAGMIDPPRQEVKAAIMECKSAGITPVMITGDHKSTAMAIAKDIGIWRPNSLALSGTELRDLDPVSFEEQASRISVYARVNPEQKMSIIAVLQGQNNFVAMTGDGVNDAPALKAANIGVAMGLTGTDVSKEASDMILMDDNFASIVNAVREGRRIFDNIRKFVKYIMTCNGAEIWVIVLAPLIGLPLPLLPIHILWINLVTDGLPGIALASEKEEPDIMQRPPVKAGESLFARGIGKHIIWVGLLMAGITLGTQAWALYQHMDHWQTMVFTVLAFSQLGHVLAIRSERTFLYSQGMFTNPLLIIAVLLTILLQAIIIYTPIGNELFNTKPLTFNELLICIGLSAVINSISEIEKLV
jgi:P-type Ca2+ transporter type 2C